MKARAALLQILTFALALSAAIAAAQDMDHHAGPTVRSTQLNIQGLNGKSITLTPEDFSSLPHKTVSVFNSHSKTNETYSGVPVTALLAQVGLPLREPIKGTLFLTGIVAEGTDKYDVLFALAEVDPSTHAGDVIVADSVDNHKLEKDGAFKMVSTEEKRPARWIRNLSSIKVIEVKP